MVFNRPRITLVSETINQRTMNCISPRSSVTIPTSIHELSAKVAIFYFEMILVSSTNCSKLNFSARSCGEIFNSAKAAASLSAAQSCFNSFSIILRRWEKPRLTIFTKAGAEIFRQQRRRAAHEAHARGVHVRRREKTFRRNLEPVARLKINLHQQRQHAVIVVVRLRHQPLRDLQLQRGDDHFRRARAGGEFHQNRRCDGIRQVRHELPIAPVARFAFNKYERVVVKQMERRVLIWLDGFR